MWWLMRDVVAYERCGGSLVARQISGAEVPGLNPASPTMKERKIKRMDKKERKIKRAEHK